MFDDLRGSKSLVRINLKHFTNQISQILAEEKLPSRILCSIDLAVELLISGSFEGEYTSSSNKYEYS